LLVRTFSFRKKHGIEFPIHNKILKGLKKLIRNFVIALSIHRINSKLTIYTGRIFVECPSKASLSWDLLFLTEGEWKELIVWLSQTRRLLDASLIFLNLLKQLVHMLFGLKLV